VKIALAATLPGVDAIEVVRAQRGASSSRLEALRAQRRDDDDLAGALALASETLAAEAEVRWLDLAAERLARHPLHARAVELSSRNPKRGRPRRVDASG
jgi:hypothetical protein